MIGFRPDIHLSLSVQSTNLKLSSAVGFDMKASQTELQNIYMRATIL